jgi:hypothetical protein
MVHKKTLTKGTWLTDINKMEYRISKDLGNEWEIEEYPSGFKLKVPKDKLLKNFKPTFQPHWVSFTGN